MYIHHKADVDGKKEHFHVYIQPSKRIDTAFLVNDSIEIDPENPDKPFKMNVFRNSKEEDWILYGLHDEAYLTEKGMSRNEHYEVDDIRSTCDDTLMEMVSRAFDYRNNKLEFRIIDAVRKNLSWYQIVASGMIPLNKIGGAKIMYSALTGQTDIE